MSNRRYTSEEAYTFLSMTDSEEEVTPLSDSGSEYELVDGSGNLTDSSDDGVVVPAKVGSRLVMQTAGILLIILGLFGKFGAIFITIPEPVIGGMFMVMFGMIAAVGISNLQ
ncbi:hypothetical protein AB205_0074100, partial [Aquarana catesbeiana]